jgi:hypothetical protein
LGGVFTIYHAARCAPKPLVFTLSEQASGG